MAKGISFTKLSTALARALTSSGLLYMHYTMKMNKHNTSASVVVYPSGWKIGSKLPIIRKKESIPKFVVTTRFYNGAYSLASIDMNTALHLHSQETRASY